MTDDLRTQLTEALADLGLDPGAELYADALLPLVEAHGRACAATALREAADHFDAITSSGGWLRARARAAEAQP